MNRHPFAPTESELESLVKHYETFGKLPTNFVRCTKSGQLITMYGSNLENRIKKYGGIRNLLTTFVSKKARSFNFVAPTDASAKVEIEPSDLIVEYFFENN